MANLQQDDVLSGDAMTPLQAALRLSLIHVEMLQLAATLEPEQARVVRYSANVLALLKRLPMGSTAADVLGVSASSCDSRVLRLFEREPGPKGVS